ncbi:Cysteine protease xcp1 [Thalictrum thalictroides]|uniref:Cysteine protease xcp1 n=1 Tax=Thalictrum thalictroides TaxID=46969 RepID=A0A7J6V7N5_THATH|nr:Cysteine protease xcp1 [Thalictrum thalictroides]
MNLQRTQLTLFFFLFASLTSLCLCVPSDDEFSILNHNPAETFISEEQVVELFQQWKEKHNKVYNNEEEMKKRFENFRASLRFVSEKNLEKRLGSSTSSHVVGLNKFADMSNEEFKEKYMSKIRKRNNTTNNKIIELKKESGKVSTCDAPASLDWRKKGVVTAVKDQGQCGCCWAFSATGAIEGINALVTGDLISISEQELVECDTNDSGCNGGLMDTAFAWIKSNGGLNTESAYPYTGYGGTCKTAKKQEKVVSIDGYEDISPQESALICAVLKQPISIAIVGSSYDFQLYSGGVFAGDCSSNPNDVDHAVLCGDSGRYCPPKSTCCCTVEFYGYCLSYGCCGYENAVCCAGSSYCCPPDYPICDVEEGLCLKFYGDSLGVAAKKRTTAKHKFPWTSESENTENQYQPLQWKRNRLAALH